MKWRDATCARALVALCAIALTPATAGADGTWREVAFLPWGDGPGEVGRSVAREDEQRRGPHGIALGADGRAAVIDRVNGRALVLDERGEIERVDVLPGMPGAATLLPGRALAVADEEDRRLVRVLGGTAGARRTPRWAQPPVRLVSWTDDSGVAVVQGLDPFQLRLPTSRGVVAPHKLGRGVPSVDGRHAAWAFWREGGLVLVFPPAEVVVSIPDELPGSEEGYGPGAVEVLATGDGTAVVLIEAVYTGEGPIDAVRGAMAVDADGARGPFVELPDVGPVVIPADVAALDDGTVLVLVSGEEGCSLLRTDLGAAEAGR